MPESKHFSSLTTITEFSRPFNNAANGFVEMLGTQTFQPNFTELLQREMNTFMKQETLS